MASIVPLSCVVVIVVIVVGFVAACQGHGGHGYEQQHADLVLETIFHVGCLGFSVHKPCQAISGCRTGVLAADMPKNVDISPQSKNATKVV
jgi:hypothetical protein